MIFFETLAVPNLCIFLFKSYIFKTIGNISSKQIYYIDSTPIINKFIIPIFTFFGKDITQLNFKLLDIRDKKGELLRIRIPRVDLFDIQNEIINSKAFNHLRHKSWDQGNILSYINKGVVDAGIADPKSVSRVLFIIEIVYWYMQKNGCSQSVFIINKRPWFEIYKNIAERYRIELIEFKPVKFDSFDIKNFIREHPSLYAVLKNLKFKNNGKVTNNIDLNQTKLYLDGRGDVNFNLSGEHTDFFWQINSDFPTRKILYKYHSDIEKEILNQNNVCAVKDGVIFKYALKRNYKKPVISRNTQYLEEFKSIKLMLTSYDLDRFYWSKFFRSYGVKLYLSWYKYSNDHIALSDAISDNGGISINWQMAFDGFEFAECEIHTDIVFSFSSFSVEIEKKLSSNIKYNIITGYPKDYIGPLLKMQAKLVRDKLKSYGAEKIVFVIDENSIDDSRWHTGHELQQENYSYILTKLLETPWLGVIFKPKTAKTLRNRLGSVSKLLAKAVATGRCYIYEESGRHTTSASPVLAGLSSDICIHGHLSSGTAALECALENLPTLLIDRERCLSSKLYELEEGKVIFKNWPDTINAVLKHFMTPGGIPGFGDWSAIISDLDPFRDGLAAKRIGTYLHWLIQGFEQGKDREVIMLEAAEKYRGIWGEEMVISTGLLI